jgi:peptide deformylase
MTMKIAQVGESVLKTPALKVEKFNTELINFTNELLATMHEARGIGIAAPQVFDPRALMIMEARPNERYPDSPEMQPMVLINPEILEQSGEIVKDWEGCLSVPGIRGLVPRESYVRVAYQDIEGEHQEIEWQGFLARVFLHEYDHLIGKTWLDRVESVSDIVGEQVYMNMFED